MGSKERRRWSTKELARLAIPYSGGDLFIFAPDGLSRGGERVGVSDVIGRVEGFEFHDLSRYPLEGGDSGIQSRYGSHRAR